MNIINTEDQSFIKNGIAQEEGRLHTRSQVEQCTMHVSSILTKQEDTRRSTGKKIKIWTVSRMKYKRRGTDNFFRNRLKQGSLSSFFLHPIACTSRKDDTCQMIWNLLDGIGWDVYIAAQTCNRETRYNGKGQRGRYILVACGRKGERP